MAHRAKSISARDLGEKTAAVAREVLADRAREIGGRPGKIGWFPDIGIFGLIWDDIDFDRFPAAPLVETSAKITSGVGELAISEKPAVFLEKGGITMGYYPAIDMVDFQVGF